MANAVTAHAYDGVLSTVTFSLDGTVSAVATTANVIGQIVQISGTNSNNLQIDFTLEDTSNGMTLYTGSNYTGTDITANDVNQGNGAFCRGPLTCDTSAKNSGTGTITMVVYYIKM